MKQAKRIVSFVVVVGFLGTVGLVAHARNEDAVPSADQIAAAQAVSDLMLNELLAALFQEFNETTPDNVGHGKQAVSLIFNDANRDMRLVGTFAPLLGGRNDLPADRFERSALDRALAGNPTTAVEKVEGADTWVYRRSVPLSNTFHQNCVLCHSNFTPAFFDRTHNPGQWVGALVLGVPIPSGHERDPDHDNDGP
jgi:hypothetical protein